MSYRSKVAVIMKKKDYKFFKDSLKNDKDYINFMAEEDHYTAFDNYDVMSLIKDYDATLIQWNWIKWDEYTDIVIEKFMHYLSYMNNSNIPFHFIRIGEGNGTNTDIEDICCLGNTETDEWVENLNGMCNYINWDIKITIDNN